tara:strand:+ start:485 stop:643 length:159 start_codon:yes stop_codon:yes gene_type:complete
MISLSISQLSSINAVSLSTEQRIVNDFVARVKADGGSAEVVADVISNLEGLQ